MGVERKDFPTLADNIALKDSDLICFDEDAGAGNYNSVKKTVEQFFKWQGGLWLKVPVTSAQILNSFASPVLLISGAVAGGAGRAIIPEKVIFRSLFNTIGYSGGLDMLVYTQAGINAFNSTKGLDYTADVFFEIPKMENAATAEYRETENWFFTSDSAPTLGDSDGVFYIKYSIFEL